MSGWIKMYDLLSDELEIESKYEKKYTIKEALQMYEDFLNYITKFLEQEKEVLRKTFDEGKTHADLGN